MRADGPGRLIAGARNATVPSSRRNASCPSHHKSRGPNNNREGTGMCILVDTEASYSHSAAILLLTGLKRSIKDASLPPLLRYDSGSVLKAAAQGYSPMKPYNHVAPSGIHLPKKFRPDTLRNPA